MTFLDVTKLAEAEEHHRVLVRELNHRVKNLLAIMTTFVRQSGKAATNVNAFVEVLLGRLQAMAHVVDGLSHDDWRVLNVGDVLRTELEAFGAARFNVVGTAVQLPADLGMAVSLIVHELATNAVKYGALSNDAGHVDISWKVQEGQFRLEWREQDGPVAREPVEAGFGLRLIRGEVEQQRGRLYIKFESTGLNLWFELPLERGVGTDSDK